MTEQPINPDIQKVVWKPAMIERYRQITDVDHLVKYSTQYLRKAIRVNTLKITVPALVKRLRGQWNLDPVPWCHEGFWIEHRAGERTDIGNLLEHSLGYIYVQDPASMIPPLALAPKPGETVLDLCAAPGSKTTQIAAMMRNEGLIVANDLTHERLASLGINLQRMGVQNALVTQMDGMTITGAFDRILLDAPCSATGTIRRSSAALKTWNINSVKRIAGVQRKLLHHAWSLLKPGGTLVYSTCSLEPEENEQQIDDFIVGHSDAMPEPIQLNIQTKGALKSFDGRTFSGEIQKCLRLFPQDNDTEGFFVAKLMKKG